MLTRTILLPAARVGFKVATITTTSDRLVNEVILLIRFMFLFHILIMKRAGIFYIVDGFSARDEIRCTFFDVVCSNKPV